MTYTIEIKIKIKWVIKDKPWYAFGEDRHLYNLRTNRRLKQCYNAGSIGYWFGKKFVTLKALKKDLIKCKFRNL